MNHSICPDCGRNEEFILHEDGCPQFGKEVEEFLIYHRAEIEGWPEKAKESLDDLAAMQSHLFLKTIKLQTALNEANALIRKLEKRKTP